MKSFWLRMLLGLVVMEAGEVVRGVLATPEPHRLTGADKLRLQFQRARTVWMEIPQAGGASCTDYNPTYVLRARKGVEPLFVLDDPRYSRLLWTPAEMSWVTGFGGVPVPTAEVQPLIAFLMAQADAGFPAISLEEVACDHCWNYGTKKYAVTLPEEMWHPLNGGILVLELHESLGLPRRLEVVDPATEEVIKDREGLLMFSFDTQFDVPLDRDMLLDFPWHGDKWAGLNLRSVTGFPHPYYWGEGDPKDLRYPAHRRCIKHPEQCEDVWFPTDP